MLRLRKSNLGAALLAGLTTAACVQSAEPSKRKNRHGAFDAARRLQLLPWPQLAAG